MARTGGFGGSLNPFGSGSLGSLSQYDIGADLADLEVYKVEVAWGNGLATDEAYLAALTKAVNATDPNTQRRESAVNKFDDATYRIGRSKADALGLDQLIAFDQAALAKMNPSNLRYRDVEDSLQSEKASRRSRDYGKLVTAYNDGKTSTQSLLAWVSGQLGTLTKDDPDFDNWTQVKGDLGERIVSEKDAKVYQDYQQDRMKPAAFLAYISERRDSYTAGTPQYEEWARKVEDAIKQVKDEAQSDKDSAFFNRYQEGKVSDQTYLKYIATRIKGMKPDDPALGDWKHRLAQATFSLAEDKLRFDVGRNKAPVSRLVSFYRAYQRGLNPGSAEWRTVQRNLDSLRASSGGGGGGGGGSGGGAGGGGGSGGGTKQTGAGGAVGVGPALTKAGKAITPKYTLDNISGLFSIDPSANKHAIATAGTVLKVNKQSLYNALQNDDRVWLFTDPRNPNATVAEMDPQGNPTGRRVRGSAYLPVKNEAYANMLLAEAGNWNNAAEYAHVQHKYNDQARYLGRAAEAFDTARKYDAAYRTQNTQRYVDNMTDVLDSATKAGDYGLAALTALRIGATVQAQLGNPYLPGEARDKLNGIMDKIVTNPLVGNDPATGLPRALNTNDLANGNVTLNPGWHHVLSSKDGIPTWGPEFDDRQDGTWEMDHVTVATSFGGKVVKGEVKRSAAPLTPVVTLRTADGETKLPIAKGSEFISYVDERGQTVRAYSLDGKTWISPSAGMPAPQIEFLEPVRLSADKTQYVLASDPSKVVMAQNANGAWDTTPDGDAMVGWYGQSAWEGAKVQRSVHGSRGAVTDAQLKGYIDDMDVGGPGQHMMIGTVGTQYKDNQGRDIPGNGGVVNLVPSSFYRTDYGVGEKDDLYDRLRGETGIVATKTLMGRGSGTVAPKPYGTNEAELGRRYADAPPGDRYDGYDLDRNRKLTPAKPLLRKQVAPSFAGGLKRPTSAGSDLTSIKPVAIPALRKQTAPSFAGGAKKSVVPPALKGSAGADLIAKKAPVKKAPVKRRTSTAKKATAKPLPKPPTVARRLDVSRVR